MVLGREAIQAATYSSKIAPLQMVGGIVGRGAVGGSRTCRKRLPQFLFSFHLLCLRGDDLGVGKNVAGKNVHDDVQVLVAPEPGRRVL